MTRGYVLNTNVADIYLTEREAECLQAMMQSTKTVHLADNLKISPRTIEIYIYSLCNKFQVHSRKKLLLLLQENQEFLQKLNYLKKSKVVRKKINKENKKNIKKQPVKTQHTWHNYFCLESQIPLVMKKNKLDITHRPVLVDLPQNR